MRKGVKRSVIFLTLILCIVFEVISYIDAFAEEERRPQYNAQEVEDMLKECQVGFAEGDFPSLFSMEQEIYTEVLETNIGQIDIVTYGENGGNDYTINASWSEGLLGAADGSYLYCADPTADFKEGYKIPVNAGKYYSQETINAIGAFLYYYDHVYDHSTHNYRHQYMIRQCLIWNVLNYINGWYPGATIEYGNGMKDDGGYWLADSLGTLLSSKSLNWVKNHYKRMNCYGKFYEGDGQTLCKWWYNDGWIQVQKHSDSPEVTDGNDQYSLSGAEYEVYYDKECTDLAGKLVTGENGLSEKLRVLNGVCYVKEVKAPDGFLLNDAVEEIIVEADSTVVYDAYDSPEITSGTGLIKKAPLNEEKMQNDTADLTGAEYTVYTDQKCTSKAGVFITDASGISDSLSLEAGEYYVKETKAPEGFRLDKEVHKMTIEAGMTTTLEVYDEREKEKVPVKIDIQKTIQGKEIVVPDVQFEHLKPDGSSEIIVTDKNGQVQLPALEEGIHSVYEKAAPSYMVINPGKITFEVTKDNEIIVIENTSQDQYGSIELSVKEDGNGSLLVENVYVPYSITLHKENENQKKLADAEFTIYQDKECSKELYHGVTDDNGQLKFENLQTGQKYYLKEIKAPSGYSLPEDKSGADLIYEISADMNSENTKIVFWVNEKQMDSVEPSDSQNLDLKITNYSGKELPDTGSYLLVTCQTLGIVLMLIVLVFMRLRLKKEE